MKQDLLCLIRSRVARTVMSEQISSTANITTFNRRSLSLVCFELSDHYIFSNKALDNSLDSEKIFKSTISAIFYGDFQFL